MKTTRDLSHTCGIVSASVFQNGRWFDIHEVFYESPWHEAVGKVGDVLLNCFCLYLSNRSFSVMEGGAVYIRLKWGSPGVYPGSFAALYLYPLFEACLPGREIADAV